MKVGIKKLHENQWLVHAGCASIKMDHFEVELLQMTLAHLLAMESGQKHSILKSYVTLAKRLLELDDAAMQKLVREVDSEDLLVLMQASNNPDLTEQIIKNVGGILAKQLQEDMKSSPMPDLENSKRAIREVLMKTFALEAAGDIEFSNQKAKYI